MGTEKDPKSDDPDGNTFGHCQVINILYNIVDRIYIGHISGVGAAASYGSGAYPFHYHSDLRLFRFCRFRRSASGIYLDGEK